jgi:hypothetical protein
MNKLKYLITVISMIWGSAVMALEEPKYTIIKQTNDYEIRKYDDRLAGETA